MRGRVGWHFVHYCFARNSPGLGIRSTCPSFHQRDDIGVGLALEHGRRDNVGRHLVCRPMPDGHLNGIGRSCVVRECCFIVMPADGRVGIAAPRYTGLDLVHPMAHAVGARLAGHHPVAAGKRTAWPAVGDTAIGYILPRAADGGGELLRNSIYGLCPVVRCIDAGSGCVQFGEFSRMAVGSSRNTVLEYRSDAAGRLDDQNIEPADRRDEVRSTVVRLL